MSFVFLAAVIVNGQFKKSINTQKGRMANACCAACAGELYDRILRFSAHFRKVKQAEIATMIKDEVELLGGFIGDAFVQPMFLRPGADGDHLFIVPAELAARHRVSWSCCWRSRWPSSPRLRKPVLVLGRQRQISARQLAGRIAETADGYTEIHIHGAANYERADIVERLWAASSRSASISIRRSSSPNSGTTSCRRRRPFAIYLIGGYFAITGQMDVGAVVGVLLAYKDLPSPIKELIDWDQQRQDVQIVYEQVIDQFQPRGMMPEGAAGDPRTRPPPLGKGTGLGGVTVSEDGRVKRDSVSLVPDPAGWPSLANSRARARMSWARCWPGSRCQRRLPSRSTATTSGPARNTCSARARPIGQETYLFPLGARQPAVRAQDPAGDASLHDDATRAAFARGVLEGIGARRQSGARPQSPTGSITKVAGALHRAGRPRRALSRR